MPCTAPGPETVSRTAGMPVRNPAAAAAYPAACSFRKPMYRIPTACRFVMPSDCFSCHGLQCSVRSSTHLCGRGKLCDWNANHAVDVLDAYPCQCVCHHSKATGSFAALR